MLPNLAAYRQDIDIALAQPCAPTQQVGGEGPVLRRLVAIADRMEEFGKLAAEHLDTIIKDGRDAIRAARKGA